MLEVKKPAPPQDYHKEENSNSNLESSENQQDSSNFSNDIPVEIKSHDSEGEIS